MDCMNLDKAELFTSETLIKLRDAYSRNIQISDAAFVGLLQDMLNTPAWRSDCESRGGICADSDCMCNKRIISQHINIYLDRPGILLVYSHN